MPVLAKPDTDARVVEAMPWLVAAFEPQFNFGSMVRQAKFQNLENRLGFVLQVAEVNMPGGLIAVRKLERTSLMQGDTLCWDSILNAAREWMRANRSPLAQHWKVSTRLRAAELHDAA